MSGATYRIEITHDPHSELLPWDVRVWRMSDGQYLWFGSGETREEAKRAGRQWIREENKPKHETVALLVDDEGLDVHSVTR